MKKWRIASILILLSLMLASATSCNPFASNTPAPTLQSFPVTRGDLTITVSGDGRVSLLKDRMLTFGGGGKVIEVNVEEGDSVKQGQVLARLDTRDLELAVSQAELSLESAKFDLDNRSSLELAIVQAQAALELAKYNLDRMEDVSDAKDDVREAEYDVHAAREMLRWAYYSEDAVGIKYWNELLLLEREPTLAEKQKELADLLTDEDYASLLVDDLEIKKAQVKVAELQLAQAKKGLEQVPVMQKRVEVARHSLERAKQQLQEAIITAPFDGVIAKVNVKNGDAISTVAYTSTAVFQIIDPTKLELIADVDEIDMPGVKVGQKVLIEVDAFPDITLNGKVTSIQLLSKEASGVVLFPVKISFEVPAGIQVRTGMSTSASIVTSERSNVLMVANRAIAQDSQGKPVVKVRVGEKIEERAIATGISDGINTEIVSGLQEGEVVVVEKQQPAQTGGSLFGG